MELFYRGKPIDESNRIPVEELQPFFDMVAEWLVQRVLDDVVRRRSTRRSTRK